ncbi:neurochondrin isoform X3 [Cucumis melo var. makuwa]|uniref:Neurochondrin isoform X3 n=1 Tax=Cucumis melo var. makuwa TaxID=1194695 RepID=A0A5A7UX09_CUCMM|nr:neurochondrin isoform X3 [Cucumis melo var. makuwa]TYK22132.1 neurochondrin isoform X3 [Cucumis melo var. makuwa]
MRKLPLFFGEFSPRAAMAEDSKELSVIMMAGSLCALIFDFISETAFLSNPNFAEKSFDILCKLFSRIFILSQQNMNDDEMAQMDLLEIITAVFHHHTRNAGLI